MCPWACYHRQHHQPGQLLAHHHRRDIFVEPGNLTMSGYGVVYPLRLLDAAKSFTIQDPQLKANVEGYISDCYILAIMTNPQGTSVSPFNQLMTGDILAGLGPGSPARYTQWVDGTAPRTRCPAMRPIKPCAQRSSRPPKLI
jgi:hypothetical protein